jgi:membrane protease YdiL (CAAX protease family)
MKNQKKKANRKDVDLIGPLGVWIVLTVAYGLALYAFGNYETLSFIYHIGLLIVAIYYARHALRSGLGLRIGDFRYGAALCVAFVGYLVGHSLIYGWPRFAFALDLATFSTILSAPIIEELFWRGLILQRMLKYPQVDVVGIVIANACFFSLMHVPRILFFNEASTTLIAILILGIVFAAICYITKSVYYSTIAHIMQNIFTL